ncbi:hypothetical protein MVEN_00257300 [Mycena venus]|uniref:Uncharacterized protein n=1 Tax=Mycena venus TaxID=2733690 RepID=A0A8H7DCF8_9AGAR|nr:hypothetical protein MVEN_00257300 [Mycena venus]
MSSDSSPVFPPELEQEIFEMTVYLYPESTPVLVFVCRRVYEWAVRIKYNTVTPTGVQLSCPYRVLQRGIRSKSKPISFFLRVQHLYILYGNQLQETLAACTAVQSLAILPRVPSWIFPDLAALRPRRLSIRLVPLLDNMDLCRPTFTFVTHLHMFDHVSELSEHMDRGLHLLSLLPALTHLAVNIAARVAPMLARCKKLRVLVHWMRSKTWKSGSPPPEDLKFDNDDRVVCIVVEDWTCQNDWVTGTKGGMDFWARADAFVTMKRRGEIKPSSRCWIEEGDEI